MQQFLSIGASLIMEEEKVKGGELGRTDLVRLATEYVLNTPERQIRFTNKPHLVQRLTVDKERGIDYDYMGASEFENGIVGRVLAQLVEWKEKGELVFFYSEDEVVEGLCHISVVKEAVEQSKGLLSEDKNRSERQYFLKEPMNSYRFSNFICLDNAYFFSTSQNGLNFLRYLDYVSLRNQHVTKIKAHPKYTELKSLCEKVNDFLKKSEGIRLTYIGVHMDAISNRTFEKGTIQDGDFDGCIWINSNTREVHTGGFNEQDLLDALECKGALFTDDYWLREKNYINVAGSNSETSLGKMVDIFISSYEGNTRGIDEYTQNLKQIVGDMGEIMKKLAKNPALDRQTIDKLVLSPFFDYALEESNILEYLVELAGNPLSSDEVIKKVMKLFTTSACNEALYDRLIDVLDNRKRKIEGLALKTTEDIKTLYSTGIYTNQSSGEPQKGHLPPQLGINFSNNLYRLGFKTKELNVYVDPKTYQKAYNEVLIWNPEHNGATVMVGHGNYEGIEGCLNMEELTGVKQISWRNIAYVQEIDDFTFNRYHGYGDTIYSILSVLKVLEGIDIHTIFWAFSRLKDIEGGAPDENRDRLLEVINDKIGLENIKKLREFDVTQVIYDAFSGLFPGELANEQYAEFAARLNAGLHEQLDKLLKFAESGQKEAVAS